MPLPSKYAACPDCSASTAQPVSFTWWGGLLGPRLLTHVKCKSCGTCYNGKSGKSNNTAIAIYLIVGLVVGVGLGVVLAVSGN